MGGIMFGVTRESLSYEFAKKFISEFKMRIIGELNFFLGIQIKQSENKIFISQYKHARDTVKKFDIEGKNHAHTPVSTFVKISLDPTSKLQESVDYTLYRSIIRTPFYITTSILDIDFYVGVCARFQSNLKKSHLIAIKRILK